MSDYDAIIDELRNFNYKNQQIRSDLTQIENEIQNKLITNNKNFTEINQRLAVTRNELNFLLSNLNKIESLIITDSFLDHLRVEVENEKNEYKYNDEQYKKILRYKGVSVGLGFMKKTGIFLIVAMVMLFLLFLFGCFSGNNGGVNVGYRPRYYNPYPGNGFVNNYSTNMPRNHRHNVGNPSGQPIYQNSSFSHRPEQGTAQPAAPGYFGEYHGTNARSAAPQNVYRGPMTQRFFGGAPTPNPSIPQSPAVTRIFGPS